MDDSPTFDETYPKYEFSELVRLVLLLAGWVVSLRRGASRSAPIPGGIAPPPSKPEAASTFRPQGVFHSLHETRGGLP